MRRPAAALSAIALLTTGLLAACGSGGSTDSPSSSTTSAATESPSADTAADQAALDAVTVGGTAEAPTLSFDLPFSVTSSVAKLETEGTGDATLAATDLITVQYAIYSGDDATVLTDTWADARADVIPLSGLDPSFEPLVSTLVGHKVGTRVLFGLPGGTDSSGAAVASAVWLVQATGTVSQRATGAAVDPVAGLPAVTLAENGTPSIEIPADFTAPDSLVVQTLIQGDGAVVESGQYLTVQYTGWLTDGTEFDSSWDGTPFGTQIGVGAVVQGWDQGLVGQTVGSQVLLVIPPDLGYGDAGSGSIPGGAALVFVVDILAAS